jgi:hypothetical protein
MEVTIEEVQNERMNALKSRLLKFLRAFFPQAFFWVEVRNGPDNDFVIKIKTSLITVSEKSRKTILYFEEKFKEEGLTESEFEKLLYLKRRLKRDDMIRQEIRRVLLHNGILTQEEAKKILIEGFEINGLLKVSDVNEF